MIFQPSNLILTSGVELSVWNSWIICDDFSEAGTAEPYLKQLSIYKFGRYTLSVKRNLSLLQSDIHWIPLHQNDSYLDTD